MSVFHRTLTLVNEMLYAPLGLTISSVSEEQQNADYGAGVFQLNDASVRFRVAKTTPAKTGQFVAFWEKDALNRNQAFSYDDAPALLVINTFHPVTGGLGQFVFPKDVLKKHEVLATRDAKGKMAIRVYPEWDTVTSKQAAASQKWQLSYFSQVDPMNDQSLKILGTLYNHTNQQFH